MSVEMFLKLQGCNGEAVAPGHKDEIELLGWNWGVRNRGGSSMGGGAGTGKASFQDLSVTKFVDKATATLLGNCAIGKHFDTATLTCRKVGGSTPLVYLTIEMTQAFVSQVHHSHQDGSELTIETLTLNFDTIGVTYKPQSKQGTEAGSVPFKWNIRENQKA